MRVGSLFAGMGGFDLAARWMGWETVWYSEIDPYGNRLLAHHFPEARALGDMTTVDWATVPPIDLLVGGFPCQPASAAGLRKGQDDDRWLWPEFVRAIRTLKPRWIVGENVRGLLSVGGGAAFGEVLRDLAQLGYDAEWRVLSAADVGAPHKRERVWITAWLADAADDGRDGRAAPPQRSGPADQPAVGPDVRGEPVGCGGGVDDADGGRCEQRHAGERSAAESRTGHEPMGDAARGGWGAGADQPIRRVDGGGAGWGDADVPEPARLGQHGGRRAGEPERHGETGAGVGDADEQRCEERESAGLAARARWPRGRGGPVGWADAVAVRGYDGTVRCIPADAAARGPQSPLWPVAHGIPGRVARLRANGNAIVPACAYVIFQAIAAVERAR